MLFDYRSIHISHMDNNVIAVSCPKARCLMSYQKPINFEVSHIPSGQILSSCGWSAVGADINAKLDPVGGGGALGLGLGYGLVLITWSGDNLQEGTIHSITVHVYIQ